jgi:hypothetical protein
VGARRSDPKAGREAEPSSRTSVEEKIEELGPFGNHSDSAFDAGWVHRRDVDLESIT